MNKRVLCRAEFFHELSWDVCSKLKSEVALTVSSKLLDWAQCEVSKGVKGVVFYLTQTFDNIASNSACFAFMENLLDLLYTTQGDTSCKDRATSTLDDWIGKVDAKQLIRELYSCKTVVNEKIAAHSFVYKVLFDQFERRVSRKRRHFGDRRHRGFVKHRKLCASSLQDYSHLHTAERFSV